MRSGAEVPWATALQYQSPVLDIPEARASSLIHPATVYGAARVFREPGEHTHLLTSEYFCMVDKTRSAVVVVASW